MKLAFTICLLGVSTIASAQSLILEEVIVTVQKRAEQAHDVPIALTAFSGQFLDTLRVDQFERLGDFIPGLEVQEQSVNNPGFSIRGITSDDGAASTEPRVSIYQDGVSIAKSRGSYVALFDLERVTVARGPQPTLFGRSSLIGAINIVQNKAAPEFGASVTAGVGNFSESYLTGYLNGALSDSVSGRLAVYHSKRDGFIDNISPINDDLMGKNTQAIRAALRVEASEDLSFDVILNYQQDDSPGTSFKSGVFLPTGGDLNPNSAAELNTFGNFEGGRDLGVERDVWGVTLLGEWAFSDNWSLSTLTAYREFDSLEIFDPDGFGIPAILFGENAEGEQFTQDFRFNYDAGGPVTGFVGVSYFSEEGFQRVPLQFDERGALSIFGGLLLPFAPNAPRIEDLLALPGFKPLHLEQFTNFAENDAYDVYGDLTWRITDAFSLSAGLRWTFDDKLTGLQAFGQNGPSVLGPLAGSASGTLFIESTPNDERVNSSGTFDGGGWRLVGAYAPNDSMNFFVSYARGRRPDIIEASQAIGRERFSDIAAEEVDAYEIGAKLQLMDGRLSLDASAYLYDYTNFQTDIIVDPLLGLTETINAGTASSDGFEVQAIVNAHDNIMLFGSYSYNHSRFDESGSTGEAQALAGNRFRLSPDHSASLGIEFRWPLQAGSVSFIPIYAWQSQIFFDSENVPGIDQGSYGKIDLELRFDSAKADWSASAYVNNVTDEEFVIDGGNTGARAGIPTFVPGPPRLYGLRVTRHW
ncbi:MAG: TonB-dependent receptor [Pseudomonadota bacterium]